MDEVDRLAKTAPGSLARLLAVDGGAAWGPHELADLLGHQLSVRLAVDLGEPLAALARELEAAGRFPGLASLTFEGLLLHPAPPAAALRLVKEFAKSRRRDPGCGLPPEVALVLYHASIAAAAARCGEPISTLSADEARRGREWILSRPWIPASLRARLEEHWSRRPGSAPGAADR